ncbi:hypothetical protein ETH_00026170 [Eimeria tenella]|uniref:Uncharacterized protein n=1 Tax=Eimeria tenella TaxID=5802 RepID=U6KUU2_EIMTE|nr:hypothetical protein ETH_00026170 [Eimeria tenella]CDJ41731.1 hypothetical protein ETH_00026170 [Eimeria tenella]|eukprot:XP_013232481.1 hypothetical protein ETH_00026170 [Eimeria tenella]
MWGDSSMSVSEMAREEKCLSSAANEREMNRRIIKGPAAVDAIKEKVRKQKQEERSLRLNQAQ